MQLRKTWLVGVLFAFAVSLAVSGCDKDKVVDISNTLLSPEQQEMGSFTQLRLVLSLYTQRNNGNFPEQLEDALKPLGMEGYLVCPIHPNTEYVYNRPSETIDAIKKRGQSSTVIVECPNKNHVLRLYADLRLPCVPRDFFDKISQ